MSKIALVVNTISSNKDIWDMFFDQIDRHISDSFFSSKYIFVDDSGDPLPDGYKVINYDTTKKYRDQFLSGIKHVAAVFSTTSFMVLRSSLEAVMSRKTSSSAPCSS